MQLHVALTCGIFFIFVLAGSVLTPAGVWTDSTTPLWATDSTVCTVSLLSNTSPVSICDVRIGEHLWVNQRLVSNWRGNVERSSVNLWAVGEHLTSNWRANTEKTKQSKYWENKAKQTEKTKQSKLRKQSTELLLAFSNWQVPWKFTFTSFRGTTKKSSKLEQR